MSCQNQFENLLRGFHQTFLLLQQLRKLIILEVLQAVLEYFLFVVLVRKLKQTKQIIMTGIPDHILTQHIGQGVNAQKFDDGEIFHHLNS